MHLVIYVTAPLSRASLMTSDEPRPRSFAVRLFLRHESTRPSFLLHTVLCNSSASSCDSISWWSESTAVSHDEGRQKWPNLTFHIWSFICLGILSLSQTMTFSDTPFSIVLNFLLFNQTPTI
ncbi:hypothetical protein Bca52824_011293 [Brassica carinata]|uniref:Uncharacterized protein n=1 Tax=Brassica carinata TaxID=52824 RepID=A0A8X7WG13_BRACI|nr:hypothetical protein Bca52824_011293 [Brassica carinata]